MPSSIHQLTMADENLKPFSTKNFVQSSFVWWSEFSKVTGPASPSSASTPPPTSPFTRPRSLACAISVTRTSSSGLSTACSSTRLCQIEVLRGGSVTSLTSCTVFLVNSAKWNRLMWRECWDTSSHLPKNFIEMRIQCQLPTNLTFRKFLSQRKVLSLESINQVRPYAVSLVVIHANPWILVHTGSVGRSSYPKNIA